MCQSLFFQNENGILGSVIASVNDQSLMPFLLPDDNKQHWQKTPQSWNTKNGEHASIFTIENNDLTTDKHLTRKEQQDKNQQLSNGQDCNECHFLSSSTTKRIFATVIVHNCLHNCCHFWVVSVAWTKDLTHVISVDIYSMDIAPTPHIYI